MSGHNKWSTIKHKKAAADAKRGRAFSRLAKDITMAAREGGGDADLNPPLRVAVAAAKAVNMPNDNIDRAIKKGTGELAGDVLVELSYEGYAVDGVAILVHALSDNRNRTAANVRTVFSKNNGTLAATGAVSWLFHRKSRFVVTGEYADEEKLLELLFEAGADIEEVTVEDGEAEIIGAPEAFGAIVEALEAHGIPVSESGLTMIPETTVELTDAGRARQVVRLIETLEDDEDVQQVYSNFSLPEALMETLAAEG